MQLSDVQYWILCSWSLWLRRIGSKGRFIVYKGGGLVGFGMHQLKIAWPLPPPSPSAHQIFRKAQRVHSDWKQRCFLQHWWKTLPQQHKRRRRTRRHRRWRWVPVKVVFENNNVTLKFSSVAKNAFWRKHFLKQKKSLSQICRYSAFYFCL